MVRDYVMISTSYLTSNAQLKSLFGCTRQGNFVSISTNKISYQWQIENHNTEGYHKLCVRIDLVVSCNSNRKMYFEGLVAVISLIHHYGGPVEVLQYFNWINLTWFNQNVTHNLIFIRAYCCRFEKGNAQFGDKEEYKLQANAHLDCDFDLIIDLAYGGERERSGLTSKDYLIVYKSGYID